jgi:LmbE family N-acetylglucosaminyl deacetylase
MDTLNDRYIRGSGTSEARWQAWLDRNSLPRAKARSLVGPGGTLHVVAPHPDDEVLGCGGIMHEAFLAGIPSCIWAITDGERSHPESLTWQPDTLIRERAGESANALALIAPGMPRHRLGIPDGHVESFEGDVAERLSVSIRPADTVIAPWLWDGHPDHEAASRAAFRAARARGCRFLEVPIWAWHWIDPETGAFPADHANIIELDPATVDIKRRAVACFRTQLEPDPSTGKPPVLTAAMLDRVERRFEVVFQ